MKWVLVSTGVIVALVTLSYFILVYRFQEVLRIIVEKESKGKYAAETGSISLSVWKNKITVNNLSVTATDTVNAHSHYVVNISQVFLSVESIRDLLFHKKVVVNRLIISKPALEVHVHSKSVSDQSMTYRASDVITVIRNVSEHLQVKELRLSDGSFQYNSLQYPEPFSVTNIGLSILNFKAKEHLENDLMYTDEIELTIADQAWTLPGGRQDVAFQKLRFSARDQSILVDSCKLVMRGVPGADTISLLANQLRFTPRQLHDHLNHDELVVDSIIMKEPLLILHKGAHKIKDSTRSVSAALNQLFTRVNFRYVDIDEGAFRIYEVQNPEPVYTTEKLDVEVFNMNASGENVAGFSFDSVHLKLNELKFTTRDSLYQLTVQEFALKENDLIFLDARFGNAPGNLNANTMALNTPSLRFKQIDIEALMNKQLKAPYIEILRPSIHLFTKGKRQPENDSTEKFSPQDFYKVLDGLDELVDVDSFHIADGQLSLRSQNDKILADAYNINGIILINRLLESDSLIDVKKAIPVLNIAQASFKNRKVSINAEGFDFNGNLKQTLINHLEFAMENGSKIQANNIFWDFLDWDLFQVKKAIHMRRISIGELTADIKQSPPSKGNGAGINIDLGEIDIAKMNLRFSGKDQSLTLLGEQISGKNVSDHNKHIGWTSLLATFRNGNFKSKDLEASFDFADINSAAGGNLYNFNLKAGNGVRFISPKILLAGVFNSTDLSATSIESIKSDTATLFVHKQNRQSKADETKFASAKTDRKMHLAVNALKLMNTAISYQSPDSATFRTVSDISGSDLTYSNDTSTNVTYGRLQIGLERVDVVKDIIKISVPDFKLELNEGSIAGNKNQAEIKSDIDASWNNASFSSLNADSLGLQADNVTGSFAKKNFHYVTGNSFNWQSLTAFAKITDGNISYNSEAFNSLARDINWNGETKSLSTGRFLMTHHQSAEAWFASEDWQKDHLDFKGSAFRADGITLPVASAGKNEPDSVIRVRQVTVDSVAIIATRDKRMPFKHGIEKLMPTTLLKTLNKPLRVDTISINNSGVLVREISVRNGQMTSVPITRLNASIFNFTNRPTTDEYLTVVALGELVTNRIDRVHYVEAYDSLSPFEMRIQVAPMTLPSFTAITRPMASVSVTRGTSDTLQAYWTGNKYAAGGRMNFSYRDLKIFIPDEKKKAGKRFMTFLANTILRNKNRRETAVFFVRDREKFVFNYWVKTGLSGLMTSIGIKRSGKYYRRYNKVKDKYSLPEFPKEIIPLVPVNPEL